jgi:site-specific recombinase XerD
MTRLRQLMIEELDRCNYSPDTIRCYLRVVAEFAHYFHRSPDQLGPEHIRQYQAQLFRQRKLAAGTVTQHLAALRFFFVKTLKKPWSAAEAPFSRSYRLKGDRSAPAYP